MQKSPMSKIPPKMFKALNLVAAFRDLSGTTLMSKAKPQRAQGKTAAVCQIIALFTKKIRPTCKMNLGI